MSDRAIQDAIQILSGTHMADKIHVLDAVVISVDATARTCIVRATGGKSGNVLPARLMSSTDDGILILPTVGSTVTIIMSDFTSPYVSLYSGIDKIILRGGDLDGLVKVIDLTTKLNNLENKLNQLLTKYNSHTHNVISTGAPSGPCLQPESGQLTPTVQADIENTNITHG